MKDIRKDSIKDFFVIQGEKFCPLFKLFSVI